MDGAYFGGHVRPANHKEDRRDRRKAENQSDERRVVIALREREGSNRTFVASREAEGVALATLHVAPETTVYADEAAHWDALHARFPVVGFCHQDADLRTARAKGEEVEVRTAETDATDSEDEEF